MTADSPLARPGQGAVCLQGLPRLLRRPWLPSAAPAASSRARVVSARAVVLVAGTAVTSGAAATFRRWVRVLLDRSGSVVVLPAVTVAVNGVGVVGVKDRLHEIGPSSFARGAAVGTAGVHAGWTPAGRPVIVHVAATAGSGPVFVQVKEPVTCMPAVMLLGSVTLETCMSAFFSWAWAVRVKTLLDESGSAVLLPAVTVMVSELVLAGVKMAVHEIVLPGLPGATGLAVGVPGVQDEEKPGGRPEMVQVAMAAAWGPVLRQEYGTFAGTPTVRLAGMMASTACMSADGAAGWRG